MRTPCNPHALETVQTIPVSTVKAKLNEYARTVANEHVRIALTRNGTADTVLISTADLESLEETIAVLSNTEAVAALAESGKERAQGDYTSSEQMVELMRARSTTA